MRGLAVLLLVVLLLVILVIVCINKGNCSIQHISLSLGIAALITVIARGYVDRRYVSVMIGIILSMVVVLLYPSIAYPVLMLLFGVASIIIAATVVRSKMQ